MNINLTLIMQAIAFFAFITSQVVLPTIATTSLNVQVSKKPLT